MIGRASEKVKDGKLVRVEIDYADKIRNVKITGDFFLHPESLLEEIENCLVGLDVDEPEGVMASRVREVLDTSSGEMVGVTPEAIARVVKEAMR
jgi:lipoate-protein ligase A